MKTYNKQIEELREAINGSGNRNDQTAWYLVGVITSVLEDEYAKGTERGHAKWLLGELHASLTLFAGIHPVKRTRYEIVADVRAHLGSEAVCARDDKTEDLFREWHGIGSSEDTDLEEVERWAFELLN